MIATKKNAIELYEGFWHSVPNFSEGILEFYTFTWNDYIGGYFMNNDKNKSNQFDASECLIDDDVLYLASWFAEFPNYTIKYIAKDSATNDSALIINDKMFWKLDKPTNLH